MEEKEGKDSKNPQFNAWLASTQTSSISQKLKDIKVSSKYNYYVPIKNINNPKGS